MNGEHIIRVINYYLTNEVNDNQSPKKVLVERSSSQVC